jgi:hypothetical protein
MHFVIKYFLKFLKNNFISRKQTPRSGGGGGWVSKGGAATVLGLTYTVNFWYEVFTFLIIFKIFYEQIHRR